MKTCIKGINQFNFSKEIFQQFFTFLQSEMPLKDDITIVLVKDKDGQMTTGVRTPSEIRILAGGRLLIDIFRTISHEWVHEFQYQKMGLNDEKPIPDIGGPVENMASILGSIFIKKFQKEYPEHEDELYKQNQ